MTAGAAAAASTPSTAAPPWEDIHAWRLSKYDANNNNQWSQTEFDAYILDYGGSAVFSDVDTSQGGIISSSEWNSYCASIDSFAQYDTNGDCRWSCTEFDAYNTAVSGAGSCANVDTNGDGIVSRSESTSYALSPSALCGDAVYAYRFARYDADASGSWTGTEFDAYTSVYGGTGTFAAVSGGDGSMSESEYITYAKSAIGKPSCTWRLNKYDANNDDQWSQTEFNAFNIEYGSIAVFSDVDISKGGGISSSEWNTYCASSDSFAQYDTDCDGRWSSVEFSWYSKANKGVRDLSFYDSNSDGYLSWKEWGSVSTICVGCGGKKLAKYKFTKYDNDGNVFCFFIVHVYLFM